MPGTAGHAESDGKRRGSSSGVEGLDGVADVLDILRGQFRVNGKSQGRIGQALAYREVARAIAQIGEADLQVQRKRIIHFGADAVFLEERMQFVASRSLYHKLVVNVARGRSEE